jgi:hypothetical protein
MDLEDPADPRQWDSVDDRRAGFTPAQFVPHSAS